MIEVWFCEAGQVPHELGLLSRYARRHLAERLGVPPDGVPIRRHCMVCGSTGHGKPYVEGYPVHFSCSSAGGFIGVSIGNVPHGVDLVRISDVTPDASTAIAAPDEHTKNPVELATIWARKEAVLKATGHGLSIDPVTIEVSAPDVPARLLTWPEIRRPWVSISDLDAHGLDGYVAALAWLSGETQQIAVHANNGGRRRKHEA